MKSQAPPIAPPAPVRNHHRVRNSVLAAIALVLLCTCGITTYIVYTGYRSAQSRIVQTLWAGNGEYLVFEYDDGFSHSSVWVVDVDTGESQHADGYSLAAAEPSAAAAWLIPREKYPGRIAPDQDSAVADVFAWDLGGSAPPRSARDWVAWRSSAGVTALLSLRPEIGAWPSQLRFSASGTSSATAAEDLGIRSFAPIGWSPTGRYFAIRPQTDGGSRTAYMTSLNAQSRAAVIIDSETGRLASAYETTYEPSAFAAAWGEGPDDVLIIFSANPGYPSDNPALNVPAEFSILRLAPGGHPTKVRVDPEMAGQANMMPPETLGSDGRQLVLQTGGYEARGNDGSSRLVAEEFWSITATGAAVLRMQIPSAQNISLSPRGLVAYEPLGTSQLQLVVSRQDGSEARVIWREPATE